MTVDECGQSGMIADEFDNEVGIRKLQSNECFEENVLF
jgi:hypothetical protein